MASFVHGELGIDHVFVLMLENRSFDHLLGFSGITGTDAQTDRATSIRGLAGTESNSFRGTEIKVSPDAANTLSHDPPHEFDEVVTQLCGDGVAYTSGQPYPPIDMSGFVADYSNKFDPPQNGRSPVMDCFDAAKLPVLSALAREFVVCDNWFASIPGPTWPNRMFTHGASSGGLDHSPDMFEILGWESVSGFKLPNGNIFDALKKKGVSRRLYAGDDFPMVAALHNISLGDIRSYDHFQSDLQASEYPYNYVFIEPSYDIFNDYKDGTSQHPCGDVARGEELIRQTFQAIFNSPHWNSSMLIVTWDEHGGFYDHQLPPAAVPPGDTNSNSVHNKNGFTFAQYGVRVPALIISPRIPRNLIDHRLYDHASIPATIEKLFHLPALTRRDAAANSLSTLLTLDAPRKVELDLTARPTEVVPMAEAAPVVQSGMSRPNDEANQGSLPVVLHSALHQDLQIEPKAQHKRILQRVAGIHTRQQARDYLTEVQAKIRTRR